MLDDLDLTLARQHAPIVYFDALEPFVPRSVGVAVLREPGPSPSFDRYLNLEVPGRGRAEAVVEYALWTDWDIQHLYELEHVWSYVDAEGRLLFAEASWHGGHGALVQDGQLSREGERPVAYAQPGKHAMAATPEIFGRFDVFRTRFGGDVSRRSGRDGLLVGRPIAGRLEKSARRDALANGYLRRYGFEPTFRFAQRWDAVDAEMIPCADLIESIPSRLEHVLAGLEAERARRRVWAVFFDLGDTLMMETTEQKDSEATTQRAELFPGAADMLWDLRRAGYLLGLIADTRPGTYRNVLRQYGLYEAFDIFAISEEIGCVKPDRRMFEHAMRGLGLTPDEADRCVMVGNNLGRDVRGANAAGMVSVWLHFNERYPIAWADEAERPMHQATNFAELGRILERLG